ncbi:hypothetical protein OPIT5_10905 [Opitutaceae bacterium TAV5]|nr:hypothetical protein OPIT5_10905 [Opitutaceae bacterium TAV5]
MTRRLSGGSFARLLALLSGLGAGAAVFAGEEPAPATRSGWDTVPLGEEAPRQAFVPAPVKKSAPAFRQKRLLDGEPLTLLDTDAGQTRLALIVPAKPRPAEKLAAEELQAAFEAMSGVRVPIFNENAVVFEKDAVLADGGPYPRAVLLGALKHGLDAGADNLPPEGFRIVTRGNHLLIAGRDGLAKSEPDNEPDSAYHGSHGERGTLYGALAFLEEECGVRWLWPGPNGTVHPKTHRIQAVRADWRDAPALNQRRVRNWGPVTRGPRGASLSSLGSRVKQGLAVYQLPLERYIENSLVAGDWFRHQRTGGSLQYRYTHAFNDWFKRHGEAHPEWFALQPDGSRAPLLPGRIRLCAANHDLTRAIARDILDKAAKSPGEISFSISPNDEDGKNFYCMDEACRRLDPPNGNPLNFRVIREEKPLAFSYPSLSDRMVDFYNRIATEVAAERPDLTLGTYAYASYRTPPLRQKLHPNVLIGFVGLTYLNDNTLEQDRRLWEGWAGVTDRLFLRPNLFHAGQGFPAIYVRKLDRDIKRCFETGMVGADFDAVVHHWATQGLNYYVLARLLWDPSQDAMALVDDYCRTGFGAAAAPVRRYFEKVEELTDRIAAVMGGESGNDTLREEEIVDVLKQAGSRQGFFAVASRIYTPEQLGELESLLDEAAGIASVDTAVAARVEFLRAGLAYTRQQSRLFRLVTDQTPPPAEDIHALLEERKEVFRQIFEENFYAVGFAHAGFRERVAGILKEYRNTPKKPKPQN